MATTQPPSSAKRRRRPSGRDGSAAVVPPSLGDQAYSRIRFDILTLAFRPGAKISEGLLAQKYGLGRSPLRAALNRLAQEGLVVSHARSGTVVAPLTARDVAELFAMRLLMEPEAARLCAGALTAAQLARLKKAQNATYERGNRESQMRFLLQNREINLVLAEGCGNSRLARAVTELEDLCMRILYVTLSVTDVRASYREAHTALYDALARGDGDAARLECQRALETTARLALDTILRLPNIRDTNIA